MKRRINMKERKKGTVEGKRFNTGREMVELIYRHYFSINPSITLLQFKNEISSYNFSEKINDANDRSFLKTEASYNTLADDLKEKFYSPIPFIIEGKNYYLKTETGEPNTSKHKHFAMDHGINVVYDTSISFNNDIEVIKLKKHNNELLNFYDFETKSTLTSYQLDLLSKLKVVIVRDSNDLCCEIVGRYDLREVIMEIESILEENNHVSDFRCLLESLLELLRKLFEIESSDADYNNEGFYILSNGSFYISKEYYDSINEIEQEIKTIILKINKKLDSHGWSEDTKKLIKDILDRIYPKIISRKKYSALLGRFSASGLMITLYETTIKNWLPTVDLEKKMLDVYSHELFHAYHYVHMINRAGWHYDYQSRIVKESLARYLEYKYGQSYINDTKITSNLVRIWNDYDMLDLPYAGAKYVEKYVSLCELMFKESSKNNTEDAFHLIESASKI